MYSESSFTSPLLRLCCRALYSKIQQRCSQTGRRQLVAAIVDRNRVMTTLRNDAPDDVPEFRFGTNNFCLVYALHPTKKAFSRVQLRYMPKTRSDWFIVGPCDADWGFCEYQGRDSLGLMLLWAREYYRVGM